MIVSNTHLEIISCGFILSDMLDSCPYNKLTFLCQYPGSQRSAYSVRHTKPSANPLVLFRLLLVKILAKVIVIEIDPFNYVNSVSSYVYHPCGTTFVRGARLNLRLPYKYETPTVLVYSLVNRPLFPPPSDYSNHILSAILPGWERFWISPFDTEFTDSTFEVAIRYHMLSRSIKVQLIWVSYLSYECSKCHDNFSLTEQMNYPNKSFTICEDLGICVPRHWLGLREECIHIEPSFKSAKFLI